MAILGVFISACSESDQTRYSNHEPGRNSQGHPNIQSIWDFRTLPPLERPPALADKGELDVEGTYNSFWMNYSTELNEDRRTLLIVDPANGHLLVI